MGGSQSVRRSAEQSADTSDQADDDEQDDQSEHHHQCDRYSPPRYALILRRPGCARLTGRRIAWANTAARFEAWGSCGIRIAACHRSIVTSTDTRRHLSARNRWRIDRSTSDAIRSPRLVVQLPSQNAVSA